MKTRITITTIIMMVGVILSFSGIAAAQSNLDQVLLPGSLIPKFVDQLPVGAPDDGSLAGITVVDATSFGLGAPFPNVYNPGYLSTLPNPPLTLGGSPYNIHMREFRAQILPSTGVPADPATGFAGLPANTASYVWGYLTDADLPLVDANGVRESYLGPVVVAERGIPAYPTYLNELPYPAIGVVQTNLPIDQTLDWANPLSDTGPDLCYDGGGNLTTQCNSLPYSGPIPDSVHIHGGEVAPAYDGGPDAWWTPDGRQGIGYFSNTYEYLNLQQEGTIWFHPHAFGITRLNVYAGMAGVYPIIDPAGAPLTAMPAFPQHDIPLIIQDRSFDQDGELFYNLASNPQPNPTIHPFWIPEFIGDVICVNGKTWPNLDVEPRQYRFRLLNGSNARFYDLSLVRPMGMAPPLPPKARKTTTIFPSALDFYPIATDQGYLPNAVKARNVVIGPGERYEVVVDFSSLKPGDQIVMMNAARTPFPGGAAPTPNGTDTVMQFTVVADTSGLPLTPVKQGDPIRPTPMVPILNGFTPPSAPPAAPGGNIVRQLTLNEVIGAGGPLGLVVNNSDYNFRGLVPCEDPINPDELCTPENRETELPAVGDTEVWEIINISADAHPMHTHLAGFQLLNRQSFDMAAWITQYDTMLATNGVLPGEGPPNPYYIRNDDGAIGGNPPINAFLRGPARPPLPYEMGWKDTAIMYPGEVTRFVIRWAETDIPVFGTSVGDPTAYPFDPTSLVNGVGYVWHCHILDHEDNEMMRNYVVRAARQYIQ